jgi:hypothetical protein
VKYAVTAMAVDPATGEIVGPPRTEEIDTDTDELFRSASRPWEVEDTFHAFWNRLNDSWEHSLRAEKVIVLRVEEV